MKNNSVSRFFDLVCDKYREKKTIKSWVIKKLWV